MTKNLQKIAATILFLTIPQNIEKRVSFIEKELSNEKVIEVIENNTPNYRYHLMHLNDEISSKQRKKDFILMRLQENISDSSIEINYQNKLKETEIQLRKYYSERDSIYKLIKK